MENKYTHLFAICTTYNAEINGQVAKQIQHIHSKSMYYFTRHKVCKALRSKADVPKLEVRDSAAYYVGALCAWNDVENAHNG